MFESSQTLSLFLNGELPGNETDLEQISCEAMEGYTYDKRYKICPSEGFECVHIAFSEMENTAVTDNDWVCSRMARATSLFTLGVVGLIIGTAIFSAIADFKGEYEC
jgi:hypothetical protein